VFKYGPILLFYSQIILYEVLSESPWIFIVVTASVKDDETRGKDYTSASILHQFAA
jgi:hypothetical protein